MDSGFRENRPGAQEVHLTVLVHGNARGLHRVSAERSDVLVKRFEQAQSYVAPNHRGIYAVRLRDFEQGGRGGFWIGLSYFPPGGGAGPDCSALEKVYIVVAGQLVVKSGNTEVTLNPHDSCCILRGETHEISNRSNQLASLLVVMPAGSNPHDGFFSKAKPRPTG